MKSVKALFLTFVGLIVVFQMGAGFSWAEDPDAPVISMAVVGTNNRLDGNYNPKLSGYYVLYVLDANGSIPETLAEVRVTGPEGFDYTFDLINEHRTSIKDEGAEYNTFLAAISRI